FFTSGGTESSNTAICCSVRDLGCKHIITSPIEHHATLHTVEHLEKTGQANHSFVKLDKNGHIDLNHLEELLAGNKEKTLVTLMHANNEIGNLLKIKAAGDLCKKYDAIFHSDMVQTIGHYPIDLHDLYVHFVSGAGHKFHGPKGVGILYVNESIKINPLLSDGAQERIMRAGSLVLYGIDGFAKALEPATHRYDNDSAYITDLKEFMAAMIKENFPEVTFNGDCNGIRIYTVLTVAFPK